MLLVAKITPHVDACSSDKESVVEKRFVSAALVGYVLVASVVCGRFWLVKKDQACVLPSFVIPTFILLLLAVDDAPLPSTRTSTPSIVDHVGTSEKSKPVTYRLFCALLAYCALVSLEEYTLVGFVQFVPDAAVGDL